MVVNGQLLKVHAEFDPVTRSWGVRESRRSKGFGLWAPRRGEGWLSSGSGLRGYEERFSFPNRQAAQSYVDGYNAARRGMLGFLRRGW